MIVSEFPITPRQYQILKFLWEYYKCNDNLPSRRQICDHFEINSQNAITDHIIALVRKGYLELSEAHGKYKFTAKAKAELNEYEGYWI